MRIEPCLYCGEDLVTMSSYPNGEKWEYWTVCGGCEAQGPLCDSEEKAASAHNRLSRIVRKAEMWNKARKRLSASLNSEVEGENTAAAAEYLITKDALSEAVEGGAE